MTVAVNTIVASAQVVLQDATAIRWAATELVSWLNDAQREIVLLKPDAGATTSTIALVAGTKQTIPSDGNRLIKVVRNMSALSSGLGRKVVRIVEQEALDAAVPNWHNPATTGDAAHANVIKNYCYSEQNPRTFYVYPGSVDTSTWLEIVYSANPATIAAGANIGLPDIYANAILDYILFRAFSKESDYSANASRADAHYKLFWTSITGKTMGDKVSTPNNVRKLGTEENTGEAQNPGRYPYSTQAQ